MKKFTHLHVHSHYSLLDGLAKIDELVLYAKELGYDALALTDHGAMYGIPEFYKTATANGIKPILGVEVYVALENRFQKRAKIDSKSYHLTLLAKNYQGYKNLMKLITRAHLEGFYYKPRVDKELLEEYKEGVIALSGCLAGEIPRKILANRLDEAEEKIKEYQKIFGEDFYLEINYHPKIEESRIIKEQLIKLSKKFNIPAVATYDTHYLKPEDAEAHDILLAVQTGNKVFEEDRLTLSADDFSLCSQQTIGELFYDFPEAIENTQLIVDKCDVQLEFGKTLLPYFEVPLGETPESYLKKLCEENLPKRYKNITPEILQRFNYELEIIQKTGFASYFLIVQDFVNWAKSNGIVVGPGRGSAAGSIVSYLLNITDIDPIKYNLLFERFLNPERIQMPDIDMDFADTRRDEVVQYLRNKYGENRVAQIITFGTMAARAAVRDAGRALGLSYSFCDTIAKLIPFNATLDEALNNVIELKNLYERDQDVKKLIDSAKKLEGVARHASIHACGIVITREEITNYTPLQRAPQDENSIITQYDMYSLESLGLLKMDLLGLRNLTIIEDALNLIEKINNVKVDFNNIDEKDKKTFELLQKGETIGVFQLESAGMRRYLKELKPNDMEDLIAMISLYRPGPMDLIPQYIARKYGREKITYLHPKLEPILKPTHGIAIYQEQLLQIARDLAGFTLGEADILRRAIGKKIKSLLDAQKQKLIQGMVERGISQEIAEKIWNFIEPFAEYGFNRSHSASYAQIAFRTAYLKTHYPLEFMAALMNNEAVETERTAELVNECRRMKIEILPPDINESFEKFSVVKEKGAIRFGLLAIKNVGAAIVADIIRERKNNGTFKDIKDFLQRICHKDLNKKSLESLIKAGVFDSLAERGELLDNLDNLLEYNQEVKKISISPQVNLFSKEMSFPALRLKKSDYMSLEQKLKYEKELMGIYISDHPVKKYEEKFRKIGIYPLSQISEKLINKKVKIGGVITDIKKILTKNGRSMLTVIIEDTSSNGEITVFPDTLEKTLTFWKKDSIIILEGRVNKNNDHLNIVCEKILAYK
ncbi:MAG: DNA polymerase III subunit alpha [Patescibacteria group bacterium]|nr:DNA polymerase III subunit alpha [Patescibacteria group bacterium]